MVMNNKSVKMNKPKVSKASKKHLAKKNSKKSTKKAGGRTPLRGGSKKAGVKKTSKK